MRWNEWGARFGTGGGGIRGGIVAVVRVVFGREKRKGEWV